MNLADSFRAARWIRLVNLLLQAVLFLALFGGLNYIALNHAWRFDLTKDHRHSLSAETKSYLEGLEANVKVIVTLTDDGDNEELAQSYHDITGLLREYTYATRNNGKGKITVRDVDVYQNRKEAEELGLGPNVVALYSGNHKRIMPLQDFYRISAKGSKLHKESFLGESTLTAGILDVTSPGKKKIYFLSGHGEMRPDDVNRTRGLSQLAGELTQRNYEVAGLDLSLVSKIPDDADLIIIAAPQTRFQLSEQEMLRNFLQTRAGRLILLLEPGRQHGLENLLFDWGVVVYDKVVIDLDPNSLTENNDLRLWNYISDPISHITDNVNSLKAPIVVSPAALVVSDDLGRSPNDGLTVKKLVVTSEKAWGESDYRSGTRPEYTPGQDLKGKLGVMVISERTQPANNLPLSVPGGRLAVFGISDIVTNNRIFTAGNLDLFLATVDWAADRDTKVNIPAHVIQRFQLSLSQEELMHLRLGLLLVVPGSVALLGFIVYWTRRT